MCGEERHDADQIIGLIIKKLKEIVQKIRGEDITYQREWTREIKIGLGELGQSRGYSVGASQGKFGFPQANYGEFLCDITWSKNDGPSRNPDDTWNTDAHMEVLVLAVESELGNSWKGAKANYELVLEDFQKLPPVRATVCLMIYDEDKAGADTPGKLKEHVQAFRRRKPGDIFILVARTNNGRDASLKHRRIFVDGERKAHLKGWTEI